MLNPTGSSSEGCKAVWVQATICDGIVRSFRLLDYCYFCFGSNGKDRTMPVFLPLVSFKAIIMLFLLRSLFYVFIVILSGEMRKNPTKSMTLNQDSNLVVNMARYLGAF